MVWILSSVNLNLPYRDVSTERTDSPGTARYTALMRHLVHWERVLAHLLVLYTLQCTAKYSKKRMSVIDITDLRHSEGYHQPYDTKLTFRFVQI